MSSEKECRVTGFSYVVTLVLVISVDGTQLGTRFPSILFQGREFSENLVHLFV